ncbi:MAG: hypothetical protein ACR2QM_20125, partial [Longimicrobiales bacterium]
MTATLSGPSVSESAFGSAMSLERDLLLVGGPSSASGAGAAVVYRRDDTGAWVVEGVLTAEGASGYADGRLGSSVLMDRGRALVGAPRGASGAGSVLVFESTDGEWEQSGELIPEDGVRGSGFGVALEAARNEIWV